MRSLILGGNGFIGYNLALRLIKEGHDIVVLDKFIDEFKKIPRCEYCIADFSNLTKNLFDGIDVVYHLVHTTIPQTSNSDPVYDISSNVLGTINLLNICVKCKIKKIIYVSSGGTIYGVPQYLPIDETHPTDPICSYGISKLTIEKYLLLYQHMHGLDYEIIRLSNPYGPWQSINGKQGAIGVFIGKLLQNQKIEIWGNGEIIRDYIYIDDVVDALLLIAEKSTCNTIFNVGSACGTSLNQLIYILGQVVGKQIHVNYCENRKFDIPANILDTSKILSELNWYCKTDIQSGLRKTLDWYKENYQGLKRIEVS